LSDIPIRFVCIFTTNIYVFSFDMALLIAYLNAELLLSTWFRYHTMTEGFIDNLKSPRNHSNLKLISCYRRLIHPHFRLQLIRHCMETI